MKRFKKIYAEITNVCNLSCSFCAKTVREPRFMKVEEFSFLLNEVKPYTDYLYLHLMGEPLLHPKLKELLGLCEKNGIKVNITTNGVLVSRVKDILVNSPALRKVAFSIHSFEANNCNGVLESYIREICAFINEAKDTRLICELRLWNGDSESRSGENALNEAVLNLFARELAIQIPTGENLQGSIKLRERLFLNFAEIFDWPDHERPDTEESVFCYGLRDHIGILADGTVVPCCLDHNGSLALGNLLTTPLAEILSSERARKIYDGFSSRKAAEPLCSRCGYARRF